MVWKGSWWVNIHPSRFVASPWSSDRYRVLDIPKTSWEGTLGIIHRQNDFDSLWWFAGTEHRAMTITTNNLILSTHAVNYGDIPKHHETAPSGPYTHCPLISSIQRITWAPLKSQAGQISTFRGCLVTLSSVLAQEIRADAIAISKTAIVPSQRNKLLEMQKRTAGGRE